MSDSTVSNNQNQTFSDVSLKDNQVAQGSNVFQQKNGRDLILSQKIQKFINNYYSKEDKNLNINKFSIDCMIPLDDELIKRAENTFVYPRDNLEDLKASLKRNRMLLLTGEPGAGKNFTAISLANCMNKETQKNYEIRWYDFFSMKVGFDLFKMIKKSENFKKKIMIFKDVFSQKNQSIMDFLCSCSHEKMRYINITLRDKDTFFLFTAETGTFDQFVLSSLAIKREICYLDHDLLKKGFDLKLSHFCSLSSKRDISKATHILESKKQEIIDRLGQMSKIAHFIENYLDSILFEGKSIDEAIEESLNTRKRLEHLFLNELGANKTEFETWTFLLCLSMFNGISYVDFNEIHREMTAFLLKRIDPFRTIKDLNFALSENYFLDKASAHIVKETFTHSYLIEFCNPEDQKVLMDILMKNNRKILLEIIPFLEKYFEGHSIRKQRRQVAINLGHIGVLDPESIIFRIIKKWVKSDMQDYSHEEYYGENVGFMYEGIFTSDDKDYKKYCLRNLNTMAFSDDIVVQWTAIAAYKHIGLHDLELAMEELRKIQEEAIERGEAKQNENLLDFIYSQDNESNISDVLEKMNQIYNETIYLISYIRYSIVALTGSVISEPITVDPIDVLYELKKWIYKGNKNSRGNTAIFFLWPGGILDELENIEVIDADEDEKEKLRPNLLLYSMTVSEESLKKLADFLNNLYNKCFPEFRLEIQMELKKILFEHMEMWVLESLYNGKIKDALKNLFVQLYQIGNEELKDSIWDSINRWQVPKEKEKKKDKNEEKFKEKEAILDTFINEVKEKIIKS